MATASSVDQQNFDKLRDAYDACMDEETIKKAGVKPLMDILHDVAEMYPVQARTATKDSKRLSDTIRFLAKLGISSLVSFGAGADDKDPDTVVVVASPPWRIGLPAKDYYTDAAVLKKYEDTLSETIQQFHPELQYVNHWKISVPWVELTAHGRIVQGSGAQSYAHEVVEFEKKLAAASPDEEDRNDVTVSS